MRVEKRNRKFGSFFGNHLSGSFIMSVAKEFTTDRNTDVKTAGNRVIEGCNSLLVAYTRDIDVYIIPKISNDFNNKL